MSDPLIELSEYKLKKEIDSVKNKDVLLNIKMNNDEYINELKSEGFTEDEIKTIYREKRLFRKISLHMAKEMMDKYPNVQKVNISLDYDFDKEPEEE